MASEPPSRSLRKADYLFGVARIDLNKLRFDDAIPNGHRESSKKIQVKLLNIFKLEGCQRMEQEHFVDALITRECLSDALVSHGKTIEAFKESCNLSYGSLHDVIWLKPTEPLRCLNGLHRIAAAKRFLDKNDRWWTVRLYEKQCFEADLTTHIQEAFGHEQRYSDGTIFRNIRRYHRLADEANEKKWWARLTASKKRDLKQLLKDRNFVGRFDSLIDLPGLWPPVQLGTLHRQHGLRCTEEMMCYLEHIRKVWHTMIPRDYREFVDERTVHQLELLAPAMSKSDSEKVKSLFRQRQIFSAVTDPSRRDLLQEAIQSQRCLIPSLRTFFENQKYLEPCSNILKILLDDTDRRSLWQSFRANFFQPESLQVQLSNSVDDLRVLDVGTSSRLEAALRLGYIQLWLFCFRHFAEMTPIKPKLESRNGQQASQRPINPSLMPQLARLAVRLGFQTDKAMALARKDPERLAAEEFIRSARPDHGEDVSDHVLAIKNILAQISDSSQSASGLDFLADQSLLIERRCGRPFEHDHVRECQALYPPLMYCDVGSGIEFTSLYARADTIKAFFSHCLPAGDNIADSVLRAWAQPTEPHSVTNTSIERPVTIETTDTQQLRDDLEQCNAMRLREMDRSRALSEELNQTRNDLQQARTGMQSMNDVYEVNGRKDQTIEEKDKVIEEKDKVIKEKDKVIKEKDRVIEEKDRVIEEKNKIIQEKDKIIEERDQRIVDLTEENMDLTCGADLPLEEHHVEGIESSDYNELYARYEKSQRNLQEAREASETLEAAQTTLQSQLQQEQVKSRATLQQMVERQEQLDRSKQEYNDLKNLLQEEKAASRNTTQQTAEEVDRLSKLVDDLRSQARESKTNHTEALNTNLRRIQGLETQHSNQLAAMETRLDDAIQYRHSRSVFRLPLQLPFRDEIHTQFEKDVQSMIDQRDKNGVPANCLGIWKITYDDEEFGFLSRLYLVRKELSYVKQFIDYLRNSSYRTRYETNSVFDICIKHKEQRIQFLRLQDVAQEPQVTDADAQRLLDLGDDNRQKLFWGLKKTDLDLLRKKYSAVGRHSYYKRRKLDNPGIPPTTRRNHAKMQPSISHLNTEMQPSQKKRLVQMTDPGLASSAEPVVAPLPEIKTTSATGGSKAQPSDKQLELINQAPPEQHKSSQNKVSNISSTQHRHEDALEYESPL